MQCFAGRRLSTWKVEKERISEVSPSVARHVSNLGLSILSMRPRSRWRLDLLLTLFGVSAQWGVQVLYACAHLFKIHWKISGIQQFIPSLLTSRWTESLYTASNHTHASRSPISTCSGTALSSSSGCFFAVDKRKPLKSGIGFWCPIYGTDGTFKFRRLSGKYCIRPFLQRVSHWCWIFQLITGVSWCCRNP